MIFKIIEDVLLALKILHNAGYVYNDIKFENIMIEPHDSGEIRVLMIDFGMATNYLDSNGVHLPNEEVPTFQGNLSFATLNTLYFNRPSRKDDLLSLFQLFVNLLNGGPVPFVEDLKDIGTDATGDLDKIRTFKSKYTF